MKDVDGTLRRLGEEVLRTGDASPSLRAQLRSDVLSEEITTEGASAAYTYDPIAMRRGLTAARLGQLARSPRERRLDPGPLTAIAEGYADLAARHPRADPKRVELLAISGSMWSLAGYQANAATLAKTFQREADDLFIHGDLPSPAAQAPYRIAQLAGAILQRDIDEVARLGASTQDQLRDLGRRIVAATEDGEADPADIAVLAAYGLTGRAARSLATLWRTGNRAAGRLAVRDLEQASSVLLSASVVDTWTLVDCIAHAVEDIVATSPWLLLRRSTSWGRTWNQYLKALVLSNRPITQVWPSQRAALDAGLLDAPPRNLAATMPTSAGKTHIAEWAILHALATFTELDELWRQMMPDLAVYVVPTRALAAQVERHLAESLELIGYRVSSLFGGTEYVRYETQLLDYTDVMVVTSEKFDLLLRNVPELASRLRLVLVDEGHALDHSDRGLRLEMLLTRIKHTAPRARIVLLSAVLPNGEDIARWLEPTAEGVNHAKIEWAPSQLRTGVFYWTGAERDGQTGRIDYSQSGSSGFFVPRVLTRHLKRTKLFPAEPKDVAAALAMHFDRLGPVLIASPTKPKARAAARALGQALQRSGAAALGEATADALSAETATEQRQALHREIAEHIGAEHELAQMVLQGFAYHHSEVPQPVRHILERGYRSGALRVLCATSTLSQGMNLPTKTVIVPDTWRGQGNQVSVRDFWNTAGRAGRAFHETEGHVVLLAHDAEGARRLRNRYLNKNNIEPVISTLTELYRRLAALRLGRQPYPGQNLADLELPDPETAELSSWAEGLDIQLLAALSEEVVDTPDQQVLEDAARDLIAHTLGSHQIGVRNWSLAPLIRFAAKRVSTTRENLPDSNGRAAIVRTGLSLRGGINALDAADGIARLLADQPELPDLDDGRVFENILLTSATGVHELQRSAAKKKCPLSAVVPAATAWTSGMPMQQIHDDHHEKLGTIEITDTSALVDKVIVQDLAWVVSAILQILESRHESLAATQFSALPAKLKYGVSTSTACYAASLGLPRRAATDLAASFPTENPTFAAFLDWLTHLGVEEISRITTGEIAALLIRSTERRSPRAAQAVVLAGHGSFTSFLRGVQYAESAYYLARLPGGESLELERDHDNPVDANAIRVTHNDVFLGWIAREVTRPLALVMDSDEAPAVHVRLSTDTGALVRSQGIARLLAHDQVVLEIAVEQGGSE